MSRTVTAAAVRRKIESWLAESDEQTAIALRARPEWTDERVHTVGGVPVRIVECPTPLAVRAALHDRAEGERVALLTELSDTELGDGLLAYLSRCTVRSVDAWDVVRQLFRVDGLDPMLAESRYGGGRWVADALTEFAPLDGWPPPPGTVLTRDHALRSLTATLLGLEPDQIDIAGLLQWTTDARALLSFIALPGELVGGVADFVAELIGPAAVPLMAAVRAGHGADVIPLGLLAAVLWPPAPVSDADRRALIAAATARVEPFFGGTQPTRVQAGALCGAAEAWVDRAMDSGEREEAQRVLARADALATQVQAHPLLDASDVLSGGFRLRLRAFASAVRSAVPAATPAALAAAESALDAVERHRSAARDGVETARMALRLLRWLAGPDTSPSNLLDALHQHVRDDGWVDRARLDVFVGDLDDDVGAAYRALFQVVDARRSAHDSLFASLLASATIAESPPGALIPVEDMLDRVVAPILAKRRVLLLIMDGMGMAAATELVESLIHSGVWLELTPGGGPRVGVLAALPTVTEVSRCSLLSGRITTGQQAEEKATFAQRFPDGVLLHKADLRAGAGAALDPEVVAAVQDAFVPLVAAVVNTIDDALDRSDPGTTVWSQDTIHAVRDLLAVATDRVVVVVSDHGHVVDRGPDAVVRSHPGSGNRWRPASGAPAGDGELLVHGSRVALGDHRVVLPWREELRYGPRKAGYHGGASPAEAVIPLIVLSAGREDVVPGWSAAPVASPSWWRETAPVTAHAAAPAPVRPRKAGQPSTSEDQQTLFEMPAVAPDVLLVTPGVPAGTTAAQPTRPPLVDALLGSELYQQRRGGRGALDDDRVAALLTVLVQGGGRAAYETLAAKAGIAAFRIAGTVTALRRLLQVEGYPVIEIDPDGTTVLLNAALLAQQFELDVP